MNVVISIDTFSLHETLRNECAVRVVHTLYLEMTWYNGEQHCRIHFVSDKCVQ